MSAVVVCYEHQNELNEINHVLNNISHLNLQYFDTSHQNLLTIERQIKKNDAQFLICSKHFSEDIVKSLHLLNMQNPLLTIIYFYSFLKGKDYLDLYHAGIKFCISGKTRKANLQTVLEWLSQHHWKKIPENMFNPHNDDLAARAKKIIKYIENNPLKYCNTEKISHYLNISQSHFRKEFKKYFGIPFRQFKQDLILHYEDILLFEKKLKPRHVFSVLDYKNLSAFSRSFKSRHGHSWQTVIKSYN